MEDKIDPADGKSASFYFGFSDALFYAHIREGGKEGLSPEKKT